MTGYVAPEEVLFPVSSLLQSQGLVWSGVTLWLGMFAFHAAFASSRVAHKQHEKAPKTGDIHPVDVLWNGVKWIWKGQGRLLSLSAPIWILALALTPAVGMASPETSRNFAWNCIGFILSLLVWPIAVGVRQIATFLRTHQRTPAPGRFVALWRSALGSFLVMALLALPILIWAQSRFERDFARQFAPIERGQMVTAIQQMRGIPMR